MRKFSSGNSSARNSVLVLRRVFTVTVNYCVLEKNSDNYTLKLKFCRKLKATAAKLFPQV